MFDGVREEPSGATKTLHCIFCQRPFLVPVACSRLVQGKFSCERCVQIAWTLQQSHALSLERPSREELEEIGAHLLKISQPCAGTFYQASSGSWSLTFWYDEISDELLFHLTSLQARSSFNSLHENGGVLTFWPDNTAPRKTLSSLIKQILADGNC